MLIARFQVKDELTDEQVQELKKFLNKHRDKAKYVGVECAMIGGSLVEGMESIHMALSILADVNMDMGTMFTIALEDDDADLTTMLTVKLFDSKPTVHSEIL